MSEKLKKNQKKRKQTGFDIMYRVVTAVLAAAVFPIVYFMNLVYYALDWSSVINILNNVKDILGSENLLEGIQNLLSPSTEKVTEISDGYICFAKWDEFGSIINSFSSGETNYKDLLLHNADLRPLVISLALFAVVIVLALVIFIVAVASNKPKTVAVLSGTGVFLGIVSDIVFVVGFANPIVNGEKTLSEIFNISNAIGSIFANALGKVIELRYDNAFFTVLFLMGAILIWSVAVIIVNSDDKAEKSLREAKKAEKKAKKASKKAKKEAKKAEKATKKAENIIKEEKNEQEAE